MEPVPVTILTGFLGSGKTTLLNHILCGTHGSRIGVVLNEFGDVSIDSRLIARRDDDIMELANGCVCCTLRDDLLQSVATLLDRASPPEHVVIETTGLADPAPVAQQLLHPSAASAIRLDALVTLVDAANFDRNLDAAEQAYAQIVTGDILLINKIDLVAPDVVEQIAAGLRRLNPRSRILRCVRAQVDLGLILGLGHSHARSNTGREWTAGMRAAHQAHADHFRAVSFRICGPVDLDKFCRMLDALSTDIFRGKGILSVADLPSRLIFHLVGGRWTLAAGDPWGSGEERLTEMVFIGRNLFDADRTALESRLLACVEERSR